MTQTNQLESIFGFERRRSKEQITKQVNYCKALNLHCLRKRRSNYKLDYFHGDFEQSLSLSASQDTRNLIPKKKQRMNLDEPAHLIKNQDEQKNNEIKVSPNSVTVGTVFEKYEKSLI